MLRKLFVCLIFLTLAGPVSHAFGAEEGAKHGAADGGEKKADKKKPAVRKITTSESYVMLDPFYTSIVDGTHPQGLLMVGFGLDVPDAVQRERVDREMPRLRDAYVRSLMAYAATNVRIWRQPDAGDLGDRLQTVTDRYFAKKGVAKVLLAQVMIRLNN